MNSAIELSDVAVHRGKTPVIAGLNLLIPSGRITGLLGPSGAGKTTLMRAIMGVQTGVSGSVNVLGMPAGSRALSTKVSYDTQSSSVFDDLTVSQNLDYMRKILGKPRDVIDSTIHQVGLQGYEKRYVRQLSGGQRNRVSLAMALLTEPEVLILDEPTVGLDPVLRNELWTLFRHLADTGKTLIVSSHVMDEAQRCDSLLFMSEGKMIAQGTLPEILTSTKTTSAEEAFLVLAESEVSS